MAAHDRPPVSRDEAHRGQHVAAPLPDVTDAKGVIVTDPGAANWASSPPQLTAWVAAMLRKPRREQDRGAVAGVGSPGVPPAPPGSEAAVASAHIGRNPLDGVKPPRIEQQAMRFLTAEEVMALVGAIDKRYRALVLVGCLCGLRAGELLALRWENVDVLGRVLHVIEQTDREAGHGATKTPKTAAGRRAVSIPRAVADALAEHAR